jgi:hypothetical protein
MSEEPEKVRCRFCQDEIGSVAAERCNQCTAYQHGWRRRLPLSSTVQLFTWWLAIIAGILGARPFVMEQWREYRHRNSRTQIAFVRTDTRGNAVLVYAHLSNGGLHASTLRGYQLLLREAHVDDADLLPFVDAEHDFHNLVPASSEFTAPLDLRRLHAGQFLRNQVLAALPKAHAQLRAEVEESDGTVHWVESLPFQAELLRGVVERTLIEEKQ